MNFADWGTYLPKACDGLWRRALDLAREDSAGWLACGRVQPGKLPAQGHEISAPERNACSMERASTWLELPVPLTSRDRGKVGRPDQCVRRTSQGAAQILALPLTAAVTLHWCMDLVIGRVRSRWAVDQLQRTEKDLAVMIMRLSTATAGPCCPARCARARCAGRHEAGDQRTQSLAGVGMLSCWVEPALITEWRRPMHDYAASQDRSRDLGVLAATMTQAEPSRDVALLRRFSIAAAGRRPACGLCLERQVPGTLDPRRRSLPTLVGMVLRRSAEPAAGASNGEQGAASGLPPS